MVGSVADSSCIELRGDLMKPFRRIQGWGILGALLLLSSGAGAKDPARLTVQSEPAGAVVILDGKKLNIKTPVRINVSSGSHDIRLIKPGYQEAKRKIEIYSGTGFASFQLKPLESSPAPERKETTGIATKKPGPEENHQASKTRPDAAGGSQHPAKENDQKAVGSKSSKYKKASPARPGGLNAVDPADKAGSRKAFPVEDAEPVQVEYRSSEPEKEHKNSWTLLPIDNPFSKWLTSSADEKNEEQEAEPDKDPEDGAIIPASSGPADDKEEFFPLVIREESDETDKKTDADAKKTVPLKDSGSKKHKAEKEPDKAPAPSRREDDLTDIVPEPEIDWPESAEQLMYKAAADLPQFPEKFNVLLLGLDRRDARGILATGKPYTVERLRRRRANSDVIMVAQLDFVDKQIRMVSIPRDTKVRIPRRRGHRKINAAYAYGRENLSKRVVGKLLGIEIHRTVVADWRSAKKCISLFKGLGLDYNGFSEKEMFWHLRKRSFRRGDFRRIERQQTFMRYALGEYLRLYNETRESQGTVGMVKRGVLNMALKQGLEVVETDFTYEEAQLLTYAFRDYDIRRITMAQLSGRGRLEGAEDGDNGVYFFNPSRHHSFDDIIAKAERKSKSKRP
jgi:anionic cell wall polymer biosynthesis LytR-Cps2A-Psr (LCP) family protein